MAKITLSRTEQREIASIVALYSKNKYLFQLFMNGVTDVMSKHPLLADHLHSFKNRLKNERSFERKLRKKFLDFKMKVKGSKRIDASNVFDEIQDLAGIRLLHLHTSQVGPINNAIKAIIKEQKYRLIDGPVANTWDDEYRAMFKKWKLKTRPRDSMYTSIHYVISANTMDKTCCEIQVRTLLEEVWGEVSHRVNYPDTTRSMACSEQLKVLARVTTSGTRLVDSIFISKDEYEALCK